MYPNSLFIYIYRDSDSWYKSINKHSKSYSNMRKLMYGYGATYQNKDKYISLYEKHNDDVSRYFKNNNNFFKINLNAPLIGEKICEFCQFKHIIPFPKKYYKMI